MAVKPKHLVVTSLCCLCCDPTDLPATAADALGMTTATSSTTTNTADNTDAAGNPIPGATAASGHDSSGGENESGSSVPSGGFTDGSFPIGVFGQPRWALESWANVGCNAMVSVPAEESIEDWDQEAQRLGLAVIRPPLGDGTADRDRADLLAWLLPDEPDIAANMFVDLVESMSARWRAVDPDRKIFVNLAGPNVLLADACDYCNGPGDATPSAQCYPDNDRCYPRIIASADWISQDIYPVTGWLPSENLRDDVTVVGQTLDRLADWTDKPLFAIIEVSDQRLGFDGTGQRGPTADEYRAELWNAIIHGAQGVFYFPQAFNPFTFENVAPEMLAEMQAQHALLRDIGHVLTSAADPRAMMVKVDAAIEATWRQADGEAWLFVLNTSSQSRSATVALQGITGEAVVYNESRKVTIDSNGLSDDFGPYEVHVYVVPVQ